MSQYLTKKFKDLQLEWYKKLKEKGFEDIEDTRSSSEFLKMWHSTYFQINYVPDVFEAKEAYFIIAEEFYETYQFQDSTQKQVWFLHSEGYPLRQISASTKIKVWVVRMIINDLKKVCFK